MQCGLGPVSTSLENTDPLQLSCVQLDPEPHFLQDLMEYSRGVGIISVVQFHCSGNKTPPLHTEKAVFFKKTNPRLPFFMWIFCLIHWISQPSLPRPSYSWSHSLLTWLKAHREMKSAQPGCWPLQPCQWRKEPDQASLSIQGKTEHWIPAIASTFLCGVVMKNKKACPGITAVILQKWQNAKDPKNKHGAISIHSEKSIKTTE